MVASLLLSCLLVVQDSSLAKAEEAYRKEDYKAAYDLAKAAATAEPKRVEPRLLLGLAAGQLKQHADAVAAYTEAIALGTKTFTVFDRRGDGQLKLGKFAEAVADFDEALKIAPAFAPQHWRRGIALYYLGKHADGVEQFETHKKANPQDVENAAWHYLCNVKVVGKAEAVKQLIAVTKDPRPPMAEIQRLYAGIVKPDAVLAAADKFKADTDAGKEARFYANLYVGLWHEAEGNAAKAKEHLTLAADKFPISHYMWDIAKVHADLLKAKK